jgi:hypothetical protein
MPRRSPMLSTLDRARPVRAQPRTATLLAAGLFLVTSIRCVAGDFGGCYELRLTQWSPSIALGADIAFITPPPRVELTAIPDRTWDPHAFRVTPAAGAAPSVHRRAYWTSDGRHVDIVWTNGFSGLTMDLEERGPDLIGKAHSFWDFSRPGQTSDVTATRISCESKK